ncbi:IS30 family transposase [Enterococcus sp. AZ152]|uniref:IS30 family transposase n=1 Tax=Enterococcus sp. AZ152 TaxID=2774848 RepID=UPI003F2633D9
MAYAHLTDVERNCIAYYYAQGLSFSAIAKLVERHVSTISREIKRNKNKNGIYDPSYAQELATDRLKDKKNRSKLTTEMIDKINSKLFKRWSPEEIYFRFRKIGEEMVSTSTIYRWIRVGKVGHPKYLRRKGVPYKRSSEVNRMRGGKSIHEREKVVLERQRIGDWEVDTIVGSKGTKPVILTLVDRKSRFLLAKWCKNRKAITISRSIIYLLKEQSLCTITADNGKEFSDFEMVEKQLNTSVYFADPYCSWQRGTNENTNGLLREFLPKGIDLGTITDRQLQEYVKLINSRPRKVLKYQTPEEVYFEPT